MTTETPRPQFVQNVVLVDGQQPALGGRHNLANSLSVPVGVALDDGDAIPGVEFRSAETDHQGAFAVTLRCDPGLVVVEPITDVNHAIFVAGERVITPPLDEEPVRTIESGAVLVRLYCRGVVSRLFRAGEKPVPPYGGATPPEPTEPSPSQPAPDADVLEGDVVEHQLAEDVA